MFTIPIKIVYDNNSDKTSVYSHDRLVTEGKGKIFRAFGKNVEKAAVGEIVEIKQGSKRILNFNA
jgi:hypothetical protein